MDIRQIYRRVSFHQPFLGFVNESEQKEIAQKMAHGEYFQDARSWYTTLYIAPIAERSAFLVIAALAGIVSFVAILSVLDLLPITERERIIITSNRMDDTLVAVAPLREQGKPLNSALKKFFAANYVFKRENYRAMDYAKDVAFIQAHSDPAVWNQYVTTSSTQNPRSYASMLGRVGERTVQITDVQVNSKVEPNVATVKYVTDFKKVTGGTQTSWTATLSFYYTKVSIHEAPNPSGKPELQIEDPVFNVVSYTVAQSR